MDRRRLIKTGVAASTVAAASPRITFAQTPEASPAAAAMATPVGEIDENGFYPSGDPAVPDAWTKMPEPFKATEGVPGKGSEVTALVMTYNQPPTPKDDNPYWQGLEERLGVTWNPILVPFASYGERAAAEIASGELPDFFYLNPGQTSTPLQRFVLEGAFLDITDYVTGDNLQQYPNLASFPDYMWETAMMNGRIFGVPTPDRRPGRVPGFRIDWSEQLIGKRPENADEAFEVFVAMSKNDPDGNGSDDTWGISKYGTGWDVGLFHQIFNVPPLWRVTDDGTFEVQYGLEEYRQAVEFMRNLYAEGAYHPDAAAMGFEEAQNLFRTGRTGLHNDGSPIYGQNGVLATLRQYQPDARVENLIPFGHDGGQGITYHSAGTFGYTALPYSVTDEERVHELLSILDWFSSPFGSEEWLYKNFGEEGVHFNYNENGFPVGTDALDQQNAGLTGYMGGSIMVNWNADEPELAPLATDEMRAIYELGVDNPARNLYSPSMIENSGIMFQTVTDILNEIVVGRRDLDALDDLYEAWQSNGGEEAAREYEEAWAANQGE